MTNIKENIETKNMRTHIDSAYKFLEDHLPTRYSLEVKDRLSEKGVVVSRTTITNVRNRTNDNTRLDVLNELLSLAKEEEKQGEKLATTLAT